MVVRRFRSSLPKNYYSVPFGQKKGATCNRLVREVGEEEAKRVNYQSCSEPAVELSEGQRNKKNNKNQNTLEQMARH